MPNTIEAAEVLEIRIEALKQTIVDLETVRDGLLPHEKIQIARMDEHIKSFNESLLSFEVSLILIRATAERN